MEASDQDLLGVKLCVNLSRFEHSYCPGRSIAVRVAWFVIGLPLLRCRLLSARLRRGLLRSFGARIGREVVIKPGVRVKYPWWLTIGDASWVGEDCWIDNLTWVHIGKSVCISQGVYLCTGNHDWTDPSFPTMVEPIRIDDGAWIGARALICPGVTIGQEGVATAGSVVNHDIMLREIHSGNPASFQGKRVFFGHIPPPALSHASDGWAASTRVLSASENLLRNLAK
jgi:putative colanic acid biosynthesis acetyltransferase WcaF